MRSRNIVCALVALLVLAAMPVAAHAQWTDGGWSGWKQSYSSSGWVFNTSSPGVSAAAPSNGLNHTYIYAQYNDVMSANGANYNCDITWTYTLTGQVYISYSAGSSFGWPNGSMSNSITSGSYSIGPTDAATDSIVSPPGGTVSVTVGADAQNNPYYFSSWATASATGNGRYNP